MTEFIFEQSYSFMISIIAGFLAGTVVGGINALKKVKKLNAVELGVLDITIWLILCAIIVMVTSLYNFGEIRIYIFIGFFSGFLFYFATINWAFTKLIYHILCFLKKGLKKVISGVKKLVDIICCKG